MQSHRSHPKNLSPNKRASLQKAAAIAVLAMLPVPVFADIESISLVKTNGTPYSNNAIVSNETEVLIKVRSEGPRPLELHLFEANGPTLPPTHKQTIEAFTTHTGPLDPDGYSYIPLVLEWSGGPLETDGVPEYFVSSQRNLNGAVISQLVRVLDNGDRDNTPATGTHLNWKGLEPAQTVPSQTDLRAPVTVKQSIRETGDVDVYSFTVKAGEWIAFDVDAITPLLIPGLDSVLTLYDSDGTTVLKTVNDTNNPDTVTEEAVERDPESLNGAIKTSAFLHHAFNAGGTYFIAISGNGINKTGRYSLTVTPMTQTLSVEPDGTRKGRLYLPNPDRQLLPYNDWRDPWIDIAIIPKGKRSTVANPYTWVLIHGRSDDYTSWEDGWEALDGYFNDDQIYVLDWEAGAYSNSADWTMQGSAWIPLVGQWAAQSLLAEGVDPGQAGLAGHSWGTYVSYEITKQFERITGSDTNALVALDPAQEIPAGNGLVDLQYRAVDVDFSEFTDYSWAFFGDGPFGSAVLSETADEAFGLEYTDGILGSGLGPTLPGFARHAAPWGTFVSLIENRDNPGMLFRMFRLERLRSGTPGPWWQENSYQRQLFTVFEGLLMVEFDNSEDRKYFRRLVELKYRDLGGTERIVATSTLGNARPTFSIADTIPYYNSSTLYTGSTVNEFVVDFSEPVTGVDLHDFGFYRHLPGGDGEYLSLEDTGATLTYSNGGSRVTVGNLGALTADDGLYRISFPHEKPDVGLIRPETRPRPGIVNANETNPDPADGQRALVGDDSLAWDKDTTHPVASFQAIPGTVSSGRPSIRIEFSEPVNGLSLNSFQLKRDEVVIPLAGVELDPVEGNSFSLGGSGLETITSVPGTYILNLLTGSISDEAGLPLTGPVSMSWNMITETPFIDHPEGWAAALEGGSSAFRDVAIDDDGQIYVVGDFDGDVDMDPGPDLVELSSIHRDGFVSCYSPSGALLWAKSFGGPGDQFVHAVALTSQGNLFVAGMFETDSSSTPGSQPADFDPGAGTANAYSTGGSEDGFIMLLDGSGAFGWVQTFGDAADGDIALDVAAIPNGGNPDAAAVAGAFGSKLVLGGAPLLTSAGGTDAFLGLLDGSAGTAFWTRQYGDTSDDSASSVCLQGSRLILGGGFTGTLDFDGVPGGPALASSDGSQDGFVLSIDNAGDVDWGKSYGSTGEDEVTCVAPEPSGGIFVSGAFSGSVAFDPAKPTLRTTSYGFADAFCLRLLGNGNFDWVRKFGGSKNDRAAAVVSDFTGGAVVVGDYDGAANLDLVPGNDINGNQNVFFVQLTSAGGFRNFDGFGGALNELAYGVAAPSGFFDFVMVGSFRGGADFTPGGGSSEFFGDFDKVSGFLQLYDERLPTVTMETPASPRNTPVESLTLDFSEPVALTGGLALQLRRNGSNIPLGQATVTGSGKSYLISQLAPHTSADGDYELTLTEKAVTDQNGNFLPGETVRTWLMDTDPPSAFSDLQPGIDITPTTSAPFNFDEPIIGLEIADFVLSVNGAEVPLTGATLTGGPASWQVSNIPVAGDGEYILELPAIESGATDAAGNPPESDVRRWWIFDGAPPAAQFDFVTTAGNEPMQTIAIRFTGAPLNFTIDDLELTRDGAPLDLSEATLTGGPLLFLLGNLEPLTSVPGDYGVAFVSGHGIIDDYGRPLDPADPGLFSLETTPPVGTLASVASPQIGSIESLAILFSESVIGLDALDFTLLRNEMEVSDLDLTVTGAADSFVVGGLTSATMLPGSYELILNAEGSGIFDAHGNETEAATSSTWTVSGLVVDTEVDEFDTPSRSGSGLLSLREAIRDANGTLTSETVVLPAGNYTLTRRGSDNTGEAGDLDILSQSSSGRLHVLGEGEGVTVIRGSTSGSGSNPTGRSFQVLAGGDLDLRFLTITDGRGVSGAGVFNGGTLRVSDVIFLENSTEALPFVPEDAHSPNDGGAINNQSTGTVIIERTSFLGNEAGDNGGAIHNNRGSVSGSNTTFTGNWAGDTGGAIRGEDGSTTEFFRSTFHANIVRDAVGGAFFGGGSFTCHNCTIAENSAQFAGAIRLSTNGFGNLNNCTVVNNIARDPTKASGGLASVNSASALVLNNTIVYGNSVDPDGLNLPGDIEGPFTVAGHNIVGAITQAPTGTGSTINSDPVLAPLQRYGGLTDTMPPLPGSPAIDAGDDSSAVPEVGPLDQRGFGRVADGDGNTSNVIDIGAAENNNIAVLELVTNTANDGPGSLRNLTAWVPPGSVVFFDSETFASGNEISLTTGPILLSKDMTIDASNLEGAISPSTRVAISGNTSSRVLQVGNGAQVVIDSLDIVHGANNNGAGILVGGSSSQLTLRNARIANNQADIASGDGAGIATSGILIAENCLFENNVAVDGGGGLRVYTTGHATLRNCTFENNQGRNGGAIYATNDTDLIHCTITDNIATETGGGLYITSGAPVSIANSIVASNVGPIYAPDINRSSGPLTPVGANLIGHNEDVSSQFPEEGILVGGGSKPVVDPLLAPLADNGGPTRSRLPLANSPTLDAAVPSAKDPTTDQRGLFRTVGAASDLGALEVNPTRLEITADPTVHETGSLLLLPTLQLENSSSTPADFATLTVTSQTGPIASVSGGGVVTPSAVFEDTSARLEVAWNSFAASANFLVLDTDEDNYLGYAGDGVADTWQIGFYGEPPNAEAAPGFDKDSDGQDNEIEWLTGFDPLDPTSSFQFRILSKSGTTATLEINKVIPDRTYTVHAGTDLQTLTEEVATLNPTSVETGKQVADPGASPGRKFYRVEVTKP